MARAEVYSVFTAIERLNVPGGAVWEYAEELVADAKEYAILTAPVGKWSANPGNLKRSHDTTKTPRGKEGVNAILRNRAYYAVWVHEGTGIYGPTGMAITPNGNAPLTFNAYGVSWRLWEVRGQQANPWLREALEASMLKNA